MSGYARGEKVRRARREPGIETDGGADSDVKMKKER